MTQDTWITLGELAGLIEASPGRWDREEDLQEHLAELLQPLGFVREHVAGPGDRFDFWRDTDGLLVELKVDGSPATVFRQLLRYAERPEVKGMILATTKSSLGQRVRQSLPQRSTLQHTPLVVARLWLWGLSSFTTR